jgi:hypothetical protein
MAGTLSLLACALAGLDCLDGRDRIFKAPELATSGVVLDAPPVFRYEENLLAECERRAQLDEGTARSLSR